MVKGMWVGLFKWGPIWGPSGRVAEPSQWIGRLKEEDEEEEKVEEKEEKEEEEGGEVEHKKENEEERSPSHLHINK